MQYVERLKARLGGFSQQPTRTEVVGCQKVDSKEYDGASTEDRVVSEGGAGDESLERHVEEGGDEDDKDHEHGEADEDSVEQDEGVNTLLIRLPSLMVQQISKTNIAVVNSKAPTRWRVNVAVTGRRMHPK
jgi:hypothetical protein